VQKALGKWILFASKVCAAIGSPFWCRAALMGEQKLANKSWLINHATREFGRPLRPPVCAPQIWLLGNGMQNSNQSMSCLKTRDKPHLEEVKLLYHPFRLTLKIKIMEMVMIKSNCKS